MRAPDSEAEADIDAAARLLDDALLGRAGRPGLARLLAQARRRRFGAGAPIYAAGDAADCFYLLLDGAVTLVSPLGRRRPVRAGRFGEEAATDAHAYLTGAVAAADATVLCLPRAAMQALAEAHPALRTDLLLSLASHLAGETLARPPRPRPPEARRRHAAPGWLLVIALPLLTLAWGDALGVGRGGVIFLAIFSATIAMWVFSLVDDYIPALFALLATLLTGLVPVPVILSGFASDGFMMALSTLALGTVVVSSGLGYRVMLLLLRRLPNGQGWHNAGLFATGLLLTPIIPTANGRIALLAPFYADMADNLRLRRPGPAAGRLALSCFGGGTLFSAIFITSKSVNFAVFGLLSPQGQDHFQWMAWLRAALVTAAVLLAAQAAAIALGWRNGERPHLPRALLDRQRALLGPLTGRERAALAGVAFMAAGIVTGSLHKVQAPWLGFAMLFGLLLYGTLGKQELKEKVDWTFLLYLGGITGIVAAFNHLGLDRALAARLPDLGAAMRDHFALFVLALYAVVNLVRLAAPSNATTVILATVLMPLAQVNGVNEWLVGFIILVFSEIWWLPYQCSYYLPMRQMNRAAPLYGETRFLLLNALLNLVRLLAVYAAFPYWKILGLR
ncbi:SLC13 family permease [Burkholderia sp. LMU1-1-1.1]|uniref:SLC13 family permease n=1 Tax=Burkholderia sp. LMU1-1-1.1 TaxID=3135266 RepID=UPI0034262333